MGDIIIEEMNYKAFIIVFVNTLLLVGACAFTGFGMTVHRLSIWVPGLMVTVFFLAGFILSMSRALKVKKLITITLDGIIDESAGGAGFISYEDIKEFLIITLNDKKAIAVIPKNIERFLSKFNVMKRRQMKHNISLNLPPVAIFVDLAKDMAPEDIFTLLKKRLSDYSSLYE